MTYRASKAAVIHFTKCAAIELANYEIRVNCLAPGHIRTAIVSKSAHGMDAEQVAKFEAGIRATMRADRLWSGRGPPTTWPKRSSTSPETVLRTSPGRFCRSTAGRQRASRCRRRNSPRILKSIA